MHSAVPGLGLSFLRRWHLSTKLAVSAMLCVSIILAGCDVANVEDQPPQAQTPAIVTATSPTSPVISTVTTILSTPTILSGVETSLPVATTNAPPSERDYVVQTGDTLSGIALQFDTTVEALMQVNNLASADIIYIGQTLKVVTPESVDTQATALPDLSSTVAALEPTAPAGSTQVAQPVATITPLMPPIQPTPVVINGRTYDAYNQAVIKKGQWYHYTCEFDAAWVVLKTYGYDVGLEEQVKLVGLDKSIEPYYKQTAKGYVIYGGDVTTAYSGNYKTNFLARSSGQAMIKVFQHYNLAVTPVRDRPSLEAALLRGELVWIKTTVDFKPWKVATWVMPDGRSYQTVLGNDHALVVMGFNEDGVVIRDPLGPTSTNWQRKYEYEVSWSKFMASWGAQEFDGLAVAPPGR
ncbi:MAG TPA: LysM peptidoglycan-binding domain-containing protein [Chloroflexia bacterium]|nr:LysM peptidoglycan-binding domain-containing protein [Chloroflexia bacterium]